MCITQVLQISVPSQLGNEKIVMAVVACIAQKEGLSTERIEDLKTAVSEAVTNAIEHGNSLDQNLRVKVKAFVNPQQLQLCVADEAKHPIPQFPVQAVGRTDHRGWGMMLIHALMDEVKIKHCPEGNELQMVMYLPSTP